MPFYGRHGLKLKLKNVVGRSAFALKQRNFPILVSGNHGGRLLTNLCKGDRNMLIVTAGLIGLVVGLAAGMLFASFVIDDMLAQMAECGLPINVKRGDGR
jgi:hypothetical protein